MHKSWFVVVVTKIAKRDGWKVVVVAECVPEKCRGRKCRFATHSVANLHFLPRVDAQDALANMRKVLRMFVRC